MPTIPKNILEEDLYPPMIEYFKNKNYSIELELPIYRNRIDLVAYGMDNIVAVELKLTNWKRALRQAGYYQLGVDFSYIAMPFYVAIQVYKRKHILKQEGVGLFAILLEKSEVRELISPKKSQKKVDYIERNLYSMIRHRY